MYYRLEYEKTPNQITELFIFQTKHLYLQKIKMFSYLFLNGQRLIIITLQTAVFIFFSRYNLDNSPSVELFANFSGLVFTLIICFRQDPHGQGSTTDLPLYDCCRFSIEHETSCPSYCAVGRVLNIPK